jgi:hypothetical protein
VSVHISYGGLSDARCAGVFYFTAFARTPSRRAGVFFLEEEMDHSFWLVSVTLALLGSALGSGHSDTFHAAAITRTGRLRFAAQVDAVFPLFTPLGELHWAPGWAPEIVYPTDRDAAPGMVFRTGDGVEHVWTMTRYSPPEHTVAYNVVAHGKLVRQIEVRCRPSGDATEVSVTDSYIGLSSEGNSFIEKLDEAAYGKKMGQWQQWISAYLAGQQARP